jgi:hypothetical protein
LVWGWCGQSVGPGSLDCMASGHGEAEQDGGSRWRSQVADIMAARKQRGRPEVAVHKISPP